MRLRKRGIELAAFYCCNSAAAALSAIITSEGCNLSLSLIHIFLAAGVTLSLATRQAVTLIGLGMICAGFSVGFGVAMSQALGPFTLRAGVASSVLGIAQVCGSSLWIWLAAIIGLSAMNMLIGILIACSIVSLVPVSYTHL